MVRLKVREAKRRRRDYVYFNSTMVRLKVRKRCVPLQTIPAFQFHYGTIKRLILVFYNLYFSLFQFHYGTIKSLLITLQRYAIFISIPLWYD